MPGRQNCKGRRLNPADGQKHPILESKGAGGVHAHQPVRFRPAFGGLIQGIVFASRPQPGESIPDGFIRHAGDPKALIRLFAAGHLIDVAEDQLPFPSAVRGADEGVHSFVIHQLFQDIELLPGFWQDFELHFPGNDGQGLHTPLFIAVIVLLRLPQGNQVADGPGYNIDVIVQETPAFFPALQYPCNITADGGLFRNHQDFPHQVPSFRFAFLSAFRSAFRRI